MSNVNASINVLINTQGAVGGLRNLQNQINEFNRSMAASNAAMATSQKQLTSNLAAQIAATGAFSTSFQKVETGASRLQTAIDRNKLSLGQYFKYGIASSGAFGRVFQKEHNEIMDLASERVKRLQTQYLALGKAQNGFVDTMAVRPLQLHNADAAIGVQRQQLFNKLLRDGSTSMVNWGKNTQWAGRQLMVGFTVPLTIFGGYAASVFMDLDKQITQFKRVYGDALTPTGEADAMVRQIQDIAKEYTKYGITVADSIQMAASAAATGLQKEDLLGATEQALRLATLGQIDYQQALDATISLQSAFDISSGDLAETIDFLNATENQTIVSLDDITQAIPRVAPVIKGLGGDVKDLATFLAAMREGGVNAAEGANALKSGLASLINPSKQANETLKDMGINIDEIVTKNEGDLMGTVQDFALAIKDLSNLDRQKALATLFGKYQFARMGALFKNIIRDGSQAQRVMDLAGMSVKELAALSEKDLSRLEEAVSTKFLGAFERFKLALAPLGEEFLKVATPILEWVTGIIEKFNGASPEIKKWALIVIGALGGILPVFVMVAGLFGNFLGNMVKGASILKTFFGRLIRGGRSVQYMEGDLLDASAAARSLEGASDNVTKSLNVQREAIEALTRAYATYLTGAKEALVGVDAAAELAAATPPVPPRTTVPRIIAQPSAVTGPTGIVGMPVRPEDWASRAAWGTSRGGAMVNGDLAMAKEDAHFVKSVQLTAQQIDEIMSRPTTTQQTRASLEFLKKQIAETGGTITSYTNQVVSIPANIHRELTNAKKMMTADLRPILGMESIHAQFGGTMMKLMPQGMDPALAAQEVQAATKQLASILVRELDAIEADLLLAGKELQITSEQFESMIHNAYLELERTGSQVARQAIGEMSQISGYSTTAGSSRTGIPGRGFYKNGSEIESYYGRFGAPEFAQQKQRFDLSKQLMALPGFGNVKNAQEIFKSFSLEAKRALLAARDDVLQFTAIFISEMGKAGMEGAAQLAEQFDAAINGGALGADLANEINAGMHGGVILGPDGKPISGGGTTQQDRARGAAGAEQPKVVVPPGQAPANDFEKDLDESGKNIKGASEESGGRIRRGARAFGSALLNGSGKLQGGLFALDGLVLGLSFLDNQIGDFANKMMPAVFAFQGLSMMIPMLASPMGAVIGSLGLIAGSAIGFNMAMDMARDKMQQMAQSMIATRETVDAVGEFFGRESLAVSRRSQGIAERAQVSTPQIDKAREFLASDVGKQLFDGLQQSIEQFGQSNAAKQFAANLSAMVLQGVMTPEEARAVSSVLGEQLNNETFGIMLQGQLKTIIGPKGELLEKDPLRIALAIDRQNQSTVDSVTSQVESIADEYKSYFELKPGDLGAFWAMTPIGGMINLFNKFSLGWDNWLGDAARWSRGVLNLDDFEKVNAQLEQMGMFVGNQLAQGYENLAAAQERILTLEERSKAANKESNKADKEYKKNPTPETKKAANKASDQAYNAEADVRRANQQELRLRQSLAKQKGDLVRMYTEANAEVQGAIDRGLSSSVAEMYKDQPMMQQFYDIIDWANVPTEKTIRMKLEMASGVLDPMTFNALIQSSGSTEKASDYYINIVAKMGGDSAEATKVLQSVLSAGLGKEVEQKILLDIQSKGGAAIKETTNALNLIAEVGDDNLRKQLSLETEGMSVKELKEYEKVLDDFNNLPPKLQKKAQVAYEENGVVGLEVATKNLEWFAKIDPKDLNKTANIKFIKDEFNLTKEEIQEWKDAPASKKLDLILEWSQEGLDPNAPPEIPDPEPVTVEPTLPEQALSGINSLIQSFPWSPLDVLPNVTPLIQGIANVVSTPITQVVNFVKGTGPFGFTGGQVGPGGKIKYATGGEAKDGTVPGDGSRDSVMAMLAPGEFVIRKAAVDKYGAGFFRALNMSAYATGGSVGTGSSIQRFKDGGQVDEDKQKEIKDALKGFKDNLVEMVKTFVGINVSLKDFLKGTQTIAKSVLKGGGLEQALRNTGMTEQAIQEILGMGIDAAKAWFNKYVKKGDLTKQGRAQMSAMNASFVGEQMSGYQQRIRAARTQTSVTNYLRRNNASQSTIDEIGGDADSAQAYNLLLKERIAAEKELQKAQKKGDRKAVDKAEKKLVMANRAIRKYEQGVKAATAAEEAMAKALDPVAWAIDKIDSVREATLNKFGLLEAKFAAAFGAMERAARPAIKAAETAVDAAQDQLDLIQDQIDALEDKNDIDEFSIRTLERSKEMLQRQIDANDRLNELDQRKIDNLQREDELRNRTADALQHELEQLSSQETKIQQAYQDRIEALDKVSAVNQQIIDQQKSLLGLSESLSQGDIYAAARAVQERRAQQAQFAAEEARKSLEKASENAVANLRTSSGLTREEAEKRIEAIREQSYQTSLKIRDIEDAIYTRNQANIPLLDQQRVLDNQILVIQDQIYARETQIMTIQREKLKPAEKALEAAQKQLETLEQKLEDDKAALQIDGLTYDQLQDQISAEAEAYDLTIAQIKANQENLKVIENIVRKWEDVIKAIAKANRLARTREEDARGVARSQMQNVEKLLEKGDITAKEAEERKARIRAKLKSSLADIERQRLAAIEAARQAAIERAQSYTSGYATGGMVKGYASGNLVEGDGARDSVHALLSPGEFVMKRTAVKKYGLSMLESMNNGSFSLPSYSAPRSNAMRASAVGNTNRSTFAPVYNSYGVNVNVSGTNASADDIAVKTIAKIREMQNMRVRSARV